MSSLSLHCFHSVMVFFWFWLVEVPLTWQSLETALYAHLDAWQGYGHESVRKDTGIAKWSFTPFKLCVWQRVKTSLENSQHIAFLRPTNHANAWDPVCVSKIKRGASMSGHLGYLGHLRSNARMITFTRSFRYTSTILFIDIHCYSDVFIFSVSWCSLTVWLCILPVFLKSQDNGASFVRGPASTKGDHFDASEPVPL